MQKFLTSMIGFWFRMIYIFSKTQDTQVDPFEVLLTFHSVHGEGYFVEDETDVENPTKQHKVHDSLNCSNYTRIDAKRELVSENESITLE